jgi:hypothetical protein
VPNQHPIPTTTRNLYVVETSDSAATPHFSLQNIAQQPTDFGQAIILPSSSSSTSNQELAMMSSSASAAAAGSTLVEKGDMSFCGGGASGGGSYMDYLQSPMMSSFGSTSQPAIVATPAISPRHHRQQDSDKTNSHSFNVSASPFYPALMTSPPLEFIDNIVLCDAPSTTTPTTTADDFDALFTKFSTETLTTNAETSAAVATRSSVRESSGSYTRSLRRYR